MKRYAIVGLCFLWIINAYAQEFTDFFQDKTLRIDYFSQEMPNIRPSIWMSYRAYPHGPGAGITYQNFP